MSKVSPCGQGADILLFTQKVPVSRRQEVSTMNSFVQINPRICNGKPVITGTRIPVTVVLDQMISAGSIDEVLGLYPELTRDQVVGALQYCHSVIEHTEFEAVA